MKANRIETVVMVLLALLLAVVLILLQINVIKIDSIANIDWLRYELAGLNPTESTPAWIKDWLWTHQAPFKYRILGKFPIWVAYQAGLLAGIEQEHAFYYAFVACSFLFIFLSLFTLGIFVRALLFEIYGTIDRWTKYLLIGTTLILFCISPPILFHFKFPVHGTPNDLLGYWLMLTALYLMLRQKFTYLCVVSIVAVFCRETTLLIPFMFLFFYPYPLAKKLVIASSPVAAFVLFRTIWPGTYDILYGGHANLAKPLETISFALLIFGPLWILGTLGYFDLKKQEMTLNSPFITAMTKSFPWALLLTFSIVSLFASIREMRIAYVLFFYFIPFSVAWLYGNWKWILNFLRNRYFLLFTLFSLIVVFRVWVWLLPTDISDYSRYAKFFGVIFTGYVLYPEYNWINTMMVYLLMFLVCTPLIVPKMSHGRNA